jgi:hypothetical protein
VHGGDRERGEGGSAENRAGARPPRRGSRSALGRHRESRDDERLPDRERLEREEGEAEEAEERHLEELEALEPRHRVDPFAARLEVQELPQQADPQAAREEPQDAARPAALEVPEERPRRVAGPHPRIHAKDDPAPDEGKEGARPCEREGEHRETDSGQNPRERGRDAEPARRDSPRDAERVQQALGDQDGRKHGRERERDPHPPRERVPRQEHVVPVLEAQVQELEDEPEGKRPGERRRDEGGAAEEERTAFADGDRGVGERENRVPRERVEPRGERLDAPAHTGRGPSEDGERDRGERDRRSTSRGTGLSFRPQL